MDGGGAVNALVRFIVVNAAIAFCCFTQRSSAVDVGFELLFESNEETVENLKIDFEKPLESWMRGVYVKVGPGQFQKGVRNFTHLFDGFAKLYSWRLDATEESESASFSGAFVQSNFYGDSQALNDVAPYLLFEVTEPPFGFLERIRSLLNGIDNTNVNVLKVGSSKAGCFLAVSDFWHSYEFNPISLETISRVEPDLLLDTIWTRFRLIPIPSTAHPVPEYRNPSSLINIYSLLSPLQGLFDESVNVVRMKSGLERELIASISMPRVPYMHCLGLSKHFAIILAHPLFIDIYKMLSTAEPVNSLVWEPETDMDIYLVHLVSGDVKKVSTSPDFITHFVNAFEEGGKVHVDVITYPDADLFRSFQLAVFRDPGRRDKIQMNACLKRYVVDIAQGSVKVKTFDSTPGLEFANRLDMPVINEGWRFSRYCFVYGVVMKSDGLRLANTTLVKKGVCRRGGGAEVDDRAWYVRNHYPSEPWFVSMPNAGREDDGVLLSVVLDGERRKSYLAILNATTMALINRSYLPFAVPFTLHGRHFDII